MSGGNDVFVERRQKPRAYYCPACGTELIKADTDSYSSNAQAKCSKCRRKIIIQRCDTWFKVFLDRRMQSRA